MAVEEDRDRTQRTLRRLESEAAAQAMEHAQYSEEAEATKQRFVPLRLRGANHICIFSLPRLVLLLSCARSLSIGNQWPPMIHNCDDDDDDDDASK